MSILTSNFTLFVRTVRDRELRASFVVANPHPLQVCTSCSPEQRTTSPVGVHRHACYPPRLLRGSPGATDESRVSRRAGVRALHMHRHALGGRHQQPPARQVHAVARTARGTALLTYTMNDDCEGGSNCQSTLLGTHITRVAVQVPHTRHTHTHTHTW